jgi:MFS family permease
MTQPMMTAAQEWRRGWTLVLAAFVGFSYNSVMIAAAGVLIEPLSKEFTWDRAQASSGVSIAGAISAILSPFFGIFIDRWGTRLIALPGLVLTAFVVASFALFNGSTAVWIGLWCLYGVVTMGVKSTIWTTSVAGAFSSARGLALGITVSGAAFGQAVTPPLANWLITEFGWREAMVWLGFGWAGFALLLCVPFLHDFHLQPSVKNAEGPKSRPDLPGLSVREAWRDGALWRIAISTFCIMTVTIGLLVHQFQILVEAGVTRSHAAWLTSLFGIAGILGKLVTGVLMDRFSPNWVGGVTLASTAIAFLLLMDDVRTPVLIVIAMVMNGYAAGTKLQIVSYLTTRFAGLKNFGKIFGMMAAVISTGTSIGPVFVGWLHDVTGSYTWFLVLGIVGSLISGLLILTLPKYPVWEKPT